MKLFEENGLTLFGVEIIKPAPKDTQSAQLSVGLDDEGSSITVNSGAGAFGIYLDIDAQFKSEFQAIQKYREVSLFAEVDEAIQDIINEAIPMEPDTDLIVLNLDKLKVSDTTKQKFQEEFDIILKLLDYNNLAADIFRRWYVDGRIFFQIIVDKENTEDGIVKLVPLDSMKIKKVKEITKKRTPLGADVIDKIEEYYIYNDAGYVTQNSTTQQQGGTASAQSFKISQDSIIYCPSGFVDASSGTVLSYLNKAIRPINQLRMLEDATVIYFIARAPERRVFYVDVGNLPKLKAEQYLKDIMNRYRNKMVYDAKTGDVRDDKKYMSMLEDFWMPRREGGKGTEIDTLQGAQNVTGYLDSLEWFKNKMYESLNVPKSRLQSESGFNLGRESEISRDELKFQKFIDRLRAKYSQLFMDALRIQLTLKQICSTEEWEEIKNDIRLDFQKDNYFSEFKNQDMWQSRFAMLPQVDSYLQKYVSKKWVQKTILRFTDEVIEKMDEEMEDERDDPSAQPPNPFTGAEGSFSSNNDNPMADAGGMPPDVGGGMPPSGAPEDDEDSSNPAQMFGKQQK